MPISKAEFRLQLRHTILLHLAICAPGLLLSIVANYLGRIDLQIFTLAALAIVIPVVDFFFWRPPNFNARLLDIYPKINLNNHLLAYMLLYSPISSLAFILFLSFKERGPNLNPPFLLGRGRPALYIILALPLFGPFLWSGLVLKEKVAVGGLRSLSYWASSPTGDHLIWIGDQFLFNKKLGKEILAAPDAEINATFRHLIDQGDLTGLGASLALAHSVTRHLPNDRLPASKANPKLALGLLYDFRSVLDRDLFSFHLGRINPLALASPYMAYEAILISLVNSIVDYKIAQKLVALSNSSLDRIEQKFPELKNETINLRQEFDKSKVYAFFKERS